MTRPRLVDQLEWLDLVLERVGKGEQAALGRGDGTYVLKWCFFSKTARGNAEDFSQGRMIIFKGVESVSRSPFPFSCWVLLLHLITYPAHTSFACHRTLLRCGMISATPLRCRRRSNRGL